MRTMNVLTVPMEINMNCQVCDAEFPDHLIAPMLTTRGNFQQICPLCALQIRNQQHGLPPDTPFTGTIAGEMWEEAHKLYPDMLTCPMKNCS